MKALWMCEKGGKFPQGPPCSRKINRQMLGDCLEGLVCRGDDDGGRLDGKNR